MSRAIPFWTALLAVLALCLGGCASRPDTSASAQIEALLKLPPSPLPPGRQLGFSLQLIDALALRSHVFSAIRHPVTLVNRLSG